MREWAKGYEGVISVKPRDGYVQCSFNNMDHGNHPGLYYIHKDYLKELLRLEEFKLKKSSGGIFFEFEIR